MEFLKTILNKISPGIKKGIGIYISPSSTLEMAEYDYDLGEIYSYNRLDFEYDSVLREVNVERFEIALQNILKKIEISPQIPVTLTIPSIFINKKVLPFELQSEEIHTALISETEKNYIFKKAEPTVSWNIISADKDMRLNTVLYSALQKQLIERLNDVFKRQGLKLIAIETSYAAFVRGLSATGIVDDCIEKNQSWCILIVKNNSNAAILLNGGQILNIIEAPLALNSMETDDLYPTLSSNLIEKLEDHKVESLVIVNYSNIVDINSLITYFDFNCPIIKIQNNYYNGAPLFIFGQDMDQDPINLEVIGSACWKNAPVKFGFNFLSGSGKEEGTGFLASLGLGGNPLHVILFGLIALAFVLVATISLIALPINASLEEQYKQLFIKCAAYKEKFDKPQSKTFNLFNVVQTGFANNEKIITSFDAISAVIPEKVWISSINIDEKLNANIKGKAYSVEDIVSYYQNLLSVSKFNNLKIKSIKVVGENSEINTNTPDVSVNTIGNNQPTSQPPNGMPSNSPEMMQPQQGGSPMLPPPPASIAPGSSITSLGLKYYAFDLGNPTEVPPAATNNPQDQQKGFIPGLSDLSKNLNLGN